MTLDNKQKIQYYQTDLNGFLSLPMIVNLAVEESQKQTTKSKYNFFNLMNNDKSWVVLQYNIHILKRPKLGEDIFITTDIGLFDNFFINRSFAFYNENKEKIIEIDSLWITFSLKRRSITSAPKELGEYFPEKKVKKIDKKFIEVIEERSSIVTSKNIKVSFSDIDLNKHINNSKYIEFIINSLDSEFLEKNDPEKFEIDYLKEARIDDSLEIKTIFINEKTTQHQIYLKDKLINVSKITWKEII